MGPKAREGAKAMSLGVCIVGFSACGVEMELKTRAWRFVGSGAAEAGSIDQALTWH